MHASGVIRIETKLASQIYIKPDLTPDERTIDRVTIARQKIID